MKMTYTRFTCFLTAFCLLLGLVMGFSGAAQAETVDEVQQVSTRLFDDPPTGARPNGTPPGGMGEPPSGCPGGAPGGSSADIDYSGAVEITSKDSQSDQTYESTTADESALLIATAEAVTIANPTVTKSGNSDGGDNCNFYGLNAAVLVKNGAQSDGTTVTIRDTVITTTGSGSGGIMTTGGGTTYAYDLTVETSTWTLTGDAYISSFTGNAASVVSNGYTLYVNGVALTGTK